MSPYLFIIAPAETPLKTVGHVMSRELASQPESDDLQFPIPIQSDKETTFQKYQGKIMGQSLQEDTQRKLISLVEPIQQGS